MKPEYHRIEGLISMIDEPNREPAQRMFKENRSRFLTARGSSVNHQAWEGGYIHHLEETMNVALVLYDIFDTIRPLPFSKSDAILALYLHDLEKPWRYIATGDGLELNPELANKQETAIPFVREKIDEYGFEVSDDHWNAVKYAEGEHEDYTPGQRTQKPLAAFVHMCDTWSARGWFDEPKKEGEW